MNVMEWTVKQLEKDSECCGNCIGCKKEFAQCTDFEVDVEIG